MANVASGSQAATLDTEHTLTDQTTNVDGLYQVEIDVSVLLNGDILLIRIYTKPTSSGTLRLYVLKLLAHVQTELIWRSPLFLATDEVKLTIEQTDGTGRTFVWALKKLENMAVNVTQLSGDSTAADNAEAAFDGTGYNFPNTTIPTVTAVTNDVGITQAGADKVWSTTTRTLSAFGFSVTIGTNNDKTGYALSVAGVQAIWDTLISALTTANSIGKLLADNINATISSRASQSSVDTVDDYLDTEIAAIKAKTDNLPSDPAGQSAVEAAITSTETTLLSKLLKYVQLLARKDSAIATDNATELTAINANGGSGAGAYANTTDALEALRDRGDAAWVTADVSTALTNYGALQPTVAGRTLDVTATGAAGIDWGNIENPTTVQALSGTTVKTATDVETDTADIQSRLPAALVSGRMASDAVAISGSTAAADAVEANIGGLDAAVSSRLPTASYTAPDNATVAIVAARLGAFAGSGANTVLGFLQALARKDVAAPSDIGGTFGPTTDSLEAIKDSGSSFTLDDAAANKIADHVLRRPLASARASADGDAVALRSLLGALAKLVNRLRVNDATGKLEVYEEDDATLFGTQTVTSDPDAEPVTEVNTD